METHQTIPCWSFIRFDENSAEEQKGRNFPKSMICSEHRILD